MNENEMTNEQLEAATNPFADAVDTNQDGEVSKEELNEAVDKLAGMEADLVIVDEPASDVSSDPITDTMGLPHSAKLPELTAAELVRQSENATHVVLENPANAVDDSATVAVEKPEVDLTGKPNLQILEILMKPSSDAANLTHKVEWARHCQKWADNNECHFLGFASKDGEAMFKEMK